jgi:hypothetical protein
MTASDATSTSTGGAASTVGKVPRANMVVAETYDAWADLGPRDVHPWHRPAQPSHEDIKASPHYPVFITANPMAGSQVREGPARCSTGGLLRAVRKAPRAPRAVRPAAMPGPLRAGQCPGMGLGSWLVAGVQRAALAGSGTGTFLGRAPIGSLWGPAFPCPGHLALPQLHPQPFPPEFRRCTCGALVQASLRASRAPLLSPFAPSPHPSIPAPRPAGV